MILSSTVRYRCDICGVHSEWKEGWLEYTYAFDIRGDAAFHVCGAECEATLKAMSKKGKEVSLY